MRSSVLVLTAKFLTPHSLQINALRKEVELARDVSAQLEEIYRTYGGMVRRRCLQLLKNETDADDVAQDVFIRAYRSLSRFRKESSPATWLYRIATNACLNRIRDRKNRERLELAHLDFQEFSEPVEVWPRDLVVRVLSQFDPKTREVVLYSIVEGMTLEEVMCVTDLTMAQVRKRLSSFGKAAPKKAAGLIGDTKRRRRTR